ncbi:phage tail fiber domain-containing protein [Xanthobacter aminoxidans]|uniref:phage tail fiber domain-containing protein n=1 Tax=Xanthobacter aminoxidans TaxID=186280 RepID=UPI002022FC99|nr:phage tail fiber protein [Xanthobacter aminoxidans]MCL8384162.1 phage tail fiber protein [Xanthobacter aminoxidans]
MALSYVTYTGDGVTKNFAVPFPYLEKSHVYPTVGDTMPAFTWVNAQTVSFAVAPSDGIGIKIFRSTPKVLPVVTFYNDQAVDVERFNDAIRQALYVAQELEDLSGSVINQYVSAIQTGAWWYDVSASIPYTPLKGEYVLILPVVRDVQVPANFSGSLAYAATAPAERAQVFSIMRDLTSIGTLTFAVGSSTGVFSGSAASIPAGAVLRVALTSEADSVFKDIGITLRTTRADE